MWPNFNHSTGLLRQYLAIKRHEQAVAGWINALACYDLLFHKPLLPDAFNRAI
jgi:hypothetical protein